MRYFLDKHGAVVLRKRGRRGDGHYDIAKEVLPHHGVRPANYADHYDQMFRLNYARIVEHSNGVIEVEHGGSLTSAQERFVREKQRHGMRVKLVKIHRPPH